MVIDKGLLDSLTTKASFDFGDCCCVAWACGWGWLLYKRSQPLGCQCFGWDAYKKGDDWKFPYNHLLSRKYMQSILRCSHKHIIYVPQYVCNIWDFLDSSEANTRIRLHFEQNRYSYFNQKFETSIRIVFFLHLVCTNRCKRHSGDLTPPFLDSTSGYISKNKALQLGLKCHTLCD